MKNEKMVAILWFVPKVLRLLLFVFIIFSIPSLSSAEPIRVVTSVPPHSFVAEIIGAQNVQVSTLIDKGQDPHTFEPTPRQVMALSRARVFFTAGLEFERGLLQKITGINRKLLVLDHTEGVT